MRKNSILRSWQLFLLTLAGWLNREQQHVIEYLITENQVLKEKLGKKRILLNDAYVDKLGRRANLAQHCTSVSWEKDLFSRLPDSAACPMPAGSRRILHHYENELHFAIDGMRRPTSPGVNI